METISYANLKVEGFPYRKLLSVQISHRPNEHGTAVVEGEVDASQAQDLMQRVDETLRVSIVTTAEGQPERLFSGCVKDIALRQENAYGIVTLSLYTTSRLLDVTRKKKTYQQVSQTYGQIITDGISDKGDLHMLVTDKAIGRLIMKYDETDWEFAMRMASQLDAPLVADIASQRPQLYVGLSPSRKTVKLESSSFSYGGEPDRLSGAMAQDFAGEQVQSYEYAFIGDTVLMNGKSARIKGVRAVLSDGILSMSYELMQANAGTAGIAAPKTSSKASGKMMKGTVMNVSRDKVQVHITDVDKEYDGGGDWWFPFSTAYSSSDGSGWYCMPEQGDEVRVFFPSGQEGEAFAASSVFSQPPLNPRHKCWKAPGGKEILLTDEGMYIIGKAGKIYINLTDEKGIEIYSDKEISIMSDTRVSICAASEVDIVASNEIIIGTEEAYIDLNKSSAVLAASEVLIN
ncbi:MAG: phage baseplate assembly protein V [Roseburia sp.]|nr:phage baseplate assembly protein V [Roseburia sp.]